MNDNSELIKRSVNTALSHLGVFKVKLDVTEVSKREIKQINAQHRGIDKVTDVLSFPLLNLKPGEIPSAQKFPHDVNSETHEIQLGDILICTETAHEQAKRFKHTFDRELAFLTVHGVLHLLGYDHITDSGEHRMMKIAEEILAELGLEKTDNCQ